MKKIQKQIAQYIKAVACGEGLKDVHVYKLYYDEEDKYVYFFTYSIEGLLYPRSPRKVRQIIEHTTGIFIGSFMSCSRRIMESMGYEFIL